MFVSSIEPVEKTGQIIGNPQILWSTFCWTNIRHNICRSRYCKIRWKSHQIFFITFRKCDCVYFAINIKTIFMNNFYASQSLRFELTYATSTFKFSHTFWIYWNHRIKSDFKNNNFRRMNIQIVGQETIVPRITWFWLIADFNTFGQVQLRLSFSAPDKLQNFQSFNFSSWGRCNVCPLQISTLTSMRNTVIAWKTWHAHFMTSGPNDMLLVIVRKHVIIKLMSCYLTTLVLQYLLKHIEAVSWSAIFEVHILFPCRHKKDLWEPWRRVIALLTDNDSNIAQELRLILIRKLCLTFISWHYFDSTIQPFFSKVAITWWVRQFGLHDEMTLWNLFFFLFRIS